MTKNQNKLPVIEKAGYSLGDLAINLVFQTLVTFIALFILCVLLLFYPIGKKMEVKLKKN